MTPAPGEHPHAAPGGDDPRGRVPAAAASLDVDALFHAHGLRVTSQRRRVVAALHRGTHLTPEQVVGAVADDGGDPLPPSTVYRTLDTLEQLGVVTHTHLTHGAPTYHLAGGPPHLHLVCRRCGRVESAPVHLADGLTSALRAATGFAAEVEHMGIHGLCAACAADTASDPDDAADPGGDGTGAAAAGNGAPAPNADH